MVAAPIVTAAPGTATPAATVVVGGKDGCDNNQAANLSPVGGGGAVTPAMLPSLFPKTEAGCTLSEGVRMVLSSAEQEGGGGAAAPGGGVASPGAFSLHSMATREVIVKVRWHFSRKACVCGLTRVFS